MTRERVTDEQHGKLCRKLDELKRRVDIKALPFESALDAIQRVIEGDFGEVVPKTIPADTNSQLYLWRKFYKKFFRVNIDVRDIKVPDRMAGFDWLIVVADVAIASIVKRLEEVAKVNSRYGENFSEINSRSQRTGLGHYAIWTRGEANPEDPFRTDQTISLKEYLVLALYFWWRNGKHLNTGKSVVCTGSRDAYNYFPMVDLWDGVLQISGLDPKYKDHSSLTFRYVC